MDTWEIIFAIVIVGLSIIMPIYYSSEKKKNEQKFKKVTAKSGTDSRRKPNPEYAKKKNKEIDPNNPFAAALMDFKKKN